MPADNAASGLEQSYDRPYIAHAYDFVSTAVFAPVGGVTRLRQEALDHFAVRADERVLEMGCGSGGVSLELTRRGARVTAVDWSQPMLHKAARRAPDAVFERAEICAYEPASKQFNLVLFSFVLHELNRSQRYRALTMARSALAEGGRLGIVDHAVPDGGVIPSLLSSLVHGFEPPTSRGSWLQPGGAELELRDAGLEPASRFELARGMAFGLLASPNRFA